MSKTVHFGAGWESRDGFSNRVMDVQWWIFRKAFSEESVGRLLARVSFLWWIFTKAWWMCIDGLVNAWWIFKYRHDVSSQKRDGLANDVSSQKYDVSSNNSPLNQLTSTQSTSNICLHRAPTVPMRDYWLVNRSTALRRRWYWGCCEIGARAVRTTILDVVRWAVKMGIVGFGNPKWRKTQKKLLRWTHRNFR